MMNIISLNVILCSPRKQTGTGNKKCVNNSKLPAYIKMPCWLIYDILFHMSVSLAFATGMSFLKRYF